MKEMKHICTDCGKCCLETEMILSNQDIRLIEKNCEDISKQDFAELNKDGFYKLKNIENHCYFFDKASKLCKIYSIRPKGCKFYPIIYEKEKRTCIYDEECPRVSRFYLKEKNFKSLCEKIRSFLQSEVKMKLN